MIAMSTVITIVTVTLIQLKVNSGKQKLVQELYKKIESDPNYPMISSIFNTNELVDSDCTKTISRKLNSSKFIQLLDHFLLMNTCISDSHLSYQTTLSKHNKNQIQNITHFKSIIFFNYLTTNYIF